MKLWAVKMLFLWRLRLGYWDWDAFWAAWRQLPNAEQAAQPQPKDASK